MLKDTELPNTAQKVAEPKTYHYEYDRQGNTLSDGENTYRYDSLNRIVEVKTKNGDIQKNHYDGEGLRAELEENGRLVAFIFDGDKVVSEKTDNNTIRYIRGYELISSDSAAAKTYYHYASDELGSTTHVTDENGNVYNYYEYDAFGNFLTKAENVPNRFCFTGEQYDPLTSQYYLRARFYTPAIGRFLNEDTYYGDGLNLYAYCHNNPVIYVDPSGHDVCPLAVQKYKEKGYSDEDAVIMANYDKLREEQGIDAAERYWKEQTKGSKSGSTTADIYSFGNKSAPRGARPKQDFNVENFDSIVGPETGPLPKGASNVLDVNSAPLSGHYHMLPAGTQMPDGLDIIADGIDVIPNSPHGVGHHTIFPTRAMTVNEFNELYKSLPWQYGGKK